MAQAYKWAKDYLLCDGWCFQHSPMISTCKQCDWNQSKKRKTKYNYWYYYTQFLISIVLLINIQPHDFISTVNEVNSKITMQVILLQTVQLSNYKFAGCSMSQLVLITYACRNKHKSDLYRSVYNYMDVHHLPSASMPEHKWFSGKNFRLWLPFRTPRFDFCTGFQFSFTNGSSTHASQLGVC